MSWAIGAGELGGGRGRSWGTAEDTEASDELGELVVALGQLLVLDRELLTQGGD